MAFVCRICCTFLSDPTKEKTSNSALYRHASKEGFSILLKPVQLYSTADGDSIPASIGMQAYHNSSSTCFDRSKQCY